MAFFFLLVYTVFIYIRPQDIYPEEMADIPVVRITAVVAGSLAFFSNKFNTEKVWNTNQGKFLVYFFSVAVLSRVPSFWLGGVIDAVFIVGQIIILYTLIVNLLDTPKKVKFYIGFVIVLTVILSIQGIQQGMTGKGWGGQTPLIEGERDEFEEFIPETIRMRVRGLGIFADPNDYGQVMVLAIPLLITFMYGYGARFWIKVVSITSLGALLYAIYLTNSRGGYLSIIGVFASYFILKYGATKGVTPAALAVVLLIILGPTRAGGLMTMDGSGRGRVEAWSAGIAMFKSSPIVGIGMDWFSENFVITAHNTFVLTFAETGFLGIFFWVGIFYAYFKDIIAVRRFKDLNDPHKLKPFHEALMISMIGFLTAAFFLSRTWIPVPYMWVAMGSGITQFLQKDNKSLKVAFSSEDTWRIFSITIFCIVFIYFLHIFLRTLPVVGPGADEFPVVM